MCTAITFQSMQKENFFGRTMDFSHPIEPGVFVIPKDYEWYSLASCSCVADLKSLLKNVTIVGILDPVTKTAAPLHWIATDRSGKSVVIEQTKNGLEVIDNPIGVMANSPDLRWHITNLRNYMNISTTQQNEVHWGNLSLTPFGQGSGTMALPGGFTSPERFVRAAFFKTHVPVPKNSYETLITCFHIMNSLFIPKGIVLTDKGSYDYTKYVAFMNTNTCEYYFKTYNNNQILRACLWDHYDKGSKPIFLGSIASSI